MIKTKEFEAFGRQYRTTQFPAVRALEIMEMKVQHPVCVLERTEVKQNGVWTALNSAEAINELVFDDAAIIAPRLALNGILSLVGDYSFGFLREWRGAKVPTRFTSGAQSIESKNIDPTIGTLTTEGMATMKELEEYYTLEDAFKMFDALVVKGINAALSQEAAADKAKG
jgi:hypothetical protein